MRSWRNLWHGTPEYRLLAVLLATACLTGLTWWSQAPGIHQDTGDCILLHGDWLWTDAAVVDGADPGLVENGWETTPFPTRQILRTLRPGQVRWYRHRFVLPDDFPITNRILYLGPVQADHRVWINGREMGAYGSLTGNGHLDFRRPRFYGLSDDVLRPGAENVLALQVRNRLPGLIGPTGRVLAIGPIEHLQDVMVPVDRGQVLFGVMLIALGIFFLLLAHRDRLAGSFWSLAVGTMVLGVNGLVVAGWLAIPGVDATGMSQARDLLNLVPGPFLFLFVCTSILRDHVPRSLQRFSRWFLLYPVIGTVVILSGGITTSKFVDNYVNDPICLVLAGVTIVIAIRGALRGDHYARVLTASIVVFCMTVVLEILIGQLHLDLPRFFHSAGMLQLVLVMAVIVSYRLVELQEETARINEGLEARVLRRTRDLALINQEREARIREQRELLHVLCHDLANPVGAMCGAVELLGDPRTDLTRLLPLLKLATDNAAATIEFVRHLRNLADRPLVLGDVDLGAAVRDSAALLASRIAAKRLVFTNEVGIGVLIRAEPTALVNSVVANVLTNAIKFTPMGGRIRVTGTVEAGGIVMEVCDRGIGMPAHILESLFNLGAPTSRPGTEGERGTGYGMPMVHRFMMNFGGSVTATSQEDGPDAGTTVRLVFQPAGPVGGAERPGPKGVSPP